MDAHFKFELKLLEIVQRYSYIYDKAHIDHKNIKKVDLAWKAIASQLNTTDTICQNSFASIRKKFSRERRSDAVSTWPLFENASFLSPHILTRKRYSKVFLNSLNDTEEEFTLDIPEISSSHIENSGDVLYSPACTNSAISSKSPNEWCKKERNFESVSTDETELNYLRVYERNPVEKNSTTTTSAAFGQFVGVALDNMPEEERKRKIMKIMEIIHQ